MMKPTYEYLAPHDTSDEYLSCNYDSYYTGQDNNHSSFQSKYQTRLQCFLSQYYNTVVLQRKSAIHSAIEDVVKIVQDILNSVEALEPRFVSSLAVREGRYEGIRALSATEFEIILYLNQMGVFNIVDDATYPGCAMLKLSDGRKRSMSLWVEFITASGYLSARKIRSRFQTLVVQAVEKSECNQVVRIVTCNGEVKLSILEKYIVTVTPAFRCTAVWPRHVAHWPSSVQHWPPAALISEAKASGFTLLSKDSFYTKENPTHSEGDVWMLDFKEAETKLLWDTGRQKAYTILRSLSENHLQFEGRPINSIVIMTLVLLESEKHPNGIEWEELCLGDRINGILLQLISFLKNHRCLHYFLNKLDLFKGHSTEVLELSAKQTWCLLRQLLSNPYSLYSPSEDCYPGPLNTTHCI